MFNLWFFAAVTLALADWLATACHWKRIRWFTKGATLVVIIAWFSVQGGWQHGLAWFGAGLVCGLIGDVALQLPPRFFMVGLGAFLAGHLCYILGFLWAGLAIRIETGIVGAALISLNAFVFIKLLRAMRQRSENDTMRAPLVIYGMVITLMSVCAGLTLVNPVWPGVAAVCCWGGAELFLTSDTVLAYSKFVRPLKNADLIVMVTYHLAQFLITTGVLLSRA